MTVAYLDRAPQSRDFARRIFAGECLVLRGFPAVQGLVAFARELLEDAFTPHHPIKAERHLAPADFNRAMTRAARDFRTGEETLALFQALFRDLGYDRREVYVDIFKLRRQPSDRRFWSDRVGALAPHRDTWGSNLLHQINWWAPVYPVSAGSTLQLYPGHWLRPVANDSDRWDLEEYQRLRRAGGGKDYPLLPTAQEEIPRKPALALEIAPGEIAAFSGAHLHGSGPNRSGTTRFSFESRSLSLPDLQLPAPENVDGHAPRTAWSFFRNLGNGGELTPLDYRAALP